MGESLKSGLGDVIDKVREAAKDAMQDCPNYPDHVSSGHAVRLAELVDPLLMYVIDLSGALQAVATVLTMDGAPPAPCDKCLTAANMADELPPGVPYHVMPDGRFHYAGCSCECHTKRIDWYNEEQLRARSYVGRVLRGLPANPNPDVVGHLTAYLHRLAVQTETDRVQLEKVVEFLAATDVRFKAMLMTLCHAAVDLTRQHGTFERVRAARAEEQAQALLRELGDGPSIVREGREPAGPGGGAGGGGG